MSPALSTLFTFSMLILSVPSQAAEVAYPSETQDGMDRLTINQIRYASSVVENLSGETCADPTSPAAIGCKLVREEAYRFSAPFVSTSGFQEAVKAAGGIEKFREKFGLFPASAEQRRGPNADLPMGFTYNKDRTQVHINCFLCHGGQVNGSSVEGGANGRLKFSELHNSIRGKPTIALTYKVAVGDVGFSGYPGATSATDVSLFTSSTRNPKTADIDKLAALQAVTKGMVGARPKQVPVYASPWWNHAPGLRKFSFYSTGAANQSVGHLMQFAMSSNLSGRKLRALVPDFEKILACVKGVRPPRSPIATDPEKVAEGREIFNGARSPDQNCNCAKCHGNTEHGNYQYFEKAIRGSFIKTDPAQNIRMNDPQEMSRHIEVVRAIDPRVGASEFDTNEDRGYVAPPLVAMFTKDALLHNRSVPTARDLLCKTPENRPKRWAWTSHPDIFDGRAVNPHANKGGYDTSGYGFSNAGHDFCGLLKDDPKACDSLLEYLKTL